MIVLGIETSCDETAASVVTDTREIRSNVVLSQLKEHMSFGGVVPEIAARAHLEHIDTVIKAALSEANITLDDLDGIAATCGPGLIGGVMIGMMSAKAIAAVKDIPFIAINHLEGHALTARLSDDIAFPYLVLLVSGGHTQILVAEDVGIYKRWGTTLDDAAGECDFKAQYKTTGAPHLIVCGGVSANTTIRTALETLTQGHNMVLNAPPLDLCGDNGAMIAWAGIERLKRGQNDPMDFAAKPRWPLDPTAAPRHGGGVKA